MSNFFRHDRHEAAAARVFDGRLKIKRAFRLFNGLAWHAVCIDHGSPDVAMTEKCLDSPDIVIGLQKVSGETVAEGVGRYALREFRPPDSLVKRLLNMRLMQVVSPKFLRIRHVGQRLLRKKPLPDKILCSRGIFFFEQVVKKHA
jgi:hypothetical protein